MKLKRLIPNREFDPDGLLSVFLTIAFYVGVFLLVIGILAICVFWPWVIALGIVFNLIVLPLCYAMIWAFNEIFPKTRSLNKAEEND